ncbi:hypothetical protein [Streptomyces atroolivaceus]|uniref:hypothetical protein n=1 Tax=Streptomyces atroolivaceus TaxID=66869 RepID=UPI00202422F4|nr:hypothetical protein [Streptomyces atroolivaceus]
MAERGALGGLQLGGAREVGDLARHVEDDRCLRGGGVVLVGGDGQEAGDGGADRPAADAVVASEGGDRAACER